MPPRSASPRVRAVVFDVGETLLDESTEYGTWADWLGVPRHTFSAMFGAVIARGGDYRQTFQHFRPGFDLAGERLRREEADFGEHFDERDLYPDARPSLEKLKQLGFLIGAAGNQTVQAEQQLRALNLPVDFIGTSAGWEVEKPSAGFFARIVARMRLPAGGDRLCRRSIRQRRPSRPRCRYGRRVRATGSVGVHPRNSSRGGTGSAQDRVTG